MKIILANWKRMASIIGCSILISFAVPVLAKAKGLGMKIGVGAGAAFLVMSVTLLAIDIVNGADESKNLSSHKAKPEFDWSMHYFRAFAITLIMALHYCGSFGWTGLVNGFLHSSTIYFLFISGYLCQYIDSRRRDAPMSYYRKKVLNVICPFIVFSLLFGIMKGIAGFNLAFVREVAFGRVQGQYWYIPFVSVLFLVSPLLCRLGDRGLASVFAASLFAFLLFPFRPSGFDLAWPDTFYLYTYFTFFYILGFVYCRYRVAIDNILSSSKRLVLVAAGLASVMLWVVPNMGLRFPDYDFAVGVQKLLIMAAVLLLLKPLKDKRIWILDQLAKYSFTLYFVHFGLFAQTHRLHDFLLSTIPLPAFLCDIFVFLLYVIAMLLTSILFKAALGRHSRPLIGS